MAARLTEAVKAAYKEVIESRDFRNRPDAHPSLTSQRDDALRSLREDPVIGVNMLITTLFAGEAEYYLREFARQLSMQWPTMDGADGQWELAYTGFTAAKQRNDGAVLFHGETPRRLFASSKLVRALADVEASRFRLCAYFFVAYPGVVPVSEETDRRGLREQLTGQFNAEFPKFVRQRLPDVIRDEHAPQH